MYQNIAILSDIYIGSLGSPSKGGGNLALYFMSDWFIFYIGMALGGAILSWFRIFLPVRQKILAEGLLDHPYVSNIVITTVVWLVLAMLVIPFIASALLLDSKRDIFIEQVYEGAK